jgi:hypothetical protein
MWDHLLKTYVNERGQVNFEAWHASPELLQSFMKEARYVAPERIEANAAQKAYWINLYNASMIELIIENYPIYSMEQIKDQWDRDVVQVEGIGFSINDIREVLRREFEDPRIHAALYNGAISSPGLHRTVFTASNVDDELDKAMEKFLNNDMLNMLDGPGYVEISKIFEWYRSDFGKTDQQLINFLNRFSNFEIPEGTHVEFRPYDWKLIMGF